MHVFVLIFLFKLLSTYLFILFTLNVIFHSSEYFVMIILLIITQIIQLIYNIKI